LSFTTRAVLDSGCVRRMFGSDRDKVTGVQNNVIMGSFIISNVHQILLD